MSSQQPSWMNQDDGQGRAYDALAIDVQKFPRPELLSLFSRVNDIIIGQSRVEGEPCDVVESAVGLKYIELASHPSVDWVDTDNFLPQLPGMSNVFTLTITGIAVRAEKKIALTYKLDAPGQALVSGYLDDLPGNGVGHSIILYTDIIKLKDSGDALRLSQTILNINIGLKIGFTTQDLRILKWTSSGSRPFFMDPDSIIRPYTIASKTVYIREIDEVAFDAAIRHLFQGACACPQCYDSYTGTSRTPTEKLEILVMQFNLSANNKQTSPHLRSRQGLVPNLEIELGKTRKNQENHLIARDNRFENGFVQLPVDAKDVFNVPLSNVASFNESLTKHKPQAKFTSTLDSSGALTNTIKFGKAPEREKFDRELHEKFGPKYYPGFSLSELPPVDSGPNVSIRQAGQMDSMAVNRSLLSRGSDRQLPLGNGQKLLVRESIMETVQNDRDEVGVQRVIPSIPPRQRTGRNPGRDHVGTVPMNTSTQQLVHQLLQQGNSIEDLAEMLLEGKLVGVDQMGGVMRYLLDKATEKAVQAAHDNFAAVHQRAARVSEPMATAPRGTGEHNQSVQFAPDHGTEGQDADNVRAPPAAANVSRNHDYSGTAALHDLCREKNESQNQRQGVSANNSRIGRQAGGLSVSRPNIHHVEAVVHSEEAIDTPQANSTMREGNDTFRSVIESSVANVGDTTFRSVIEDSPTNVGNTTFRPVIENSATNVNNQTPGTMIENTAGNSNQAAVATLRNQTPGTIIENTAGNANEAAMSTLYQGPPSNITPVVWETNAGPMGLSRGLATSTDATQFVDNRHLSGNGGMITGRVSYSPRTQGVDYYSATESRDDTRVSRVAQDRTDTFNVRDERVVLSEGPRTITSHCGSEDIDKCEGHHPIENATEVERTIPLDNTRRGISQKVSPVSALRGPGGEHELAQAMAHGQPMLTRRGEQPVITSMLSSLPPEDRQSVNQTMNMTGIDGVPQSTRANLTSILRNSNVPGQQQRQQQQQQTEPIYEAASQISTILEDEIYLDNPPEDTMSQTLVASQSQQATSGHENLSRTTVQESRSLTGGQSSTTSDSGPA